MPITGDCIVIKEDYKFERAENIKKGDFLLNPFGKKCIVDEIETFYDNNGFEIKTENFFKFNVDKNTKVYTAPIKNVYKEDLNKISRILYKDDFKQINEIDEFDYCGLKFNTIDNINEELNKELFLYSKILLKAKYNNDEIIFKKSKIKFNELKKTSNIKLEINKNKDIFFNVKNQKCPFDINIFTKQLNQRFIENDIFLLNNNDKLYFLENFLKENTEMFIGLKHFRCIIPSKIMVTQLFYLFEAINNSIGYVELYKKNNFRFNEIKSSNKKNVFSLTYHPDLLNIINKNNTYWQKIEFIKNNNRNLKYYKIKTVNNESFYVYNIIIKEI